MDTVIQQIINALSLGAIYALLALGLAVVFSVLGMLNFAYGELVTGVGYTIWLLMTVGVGFWVAGVMGILIAVVLAMLTETIAFRPLRKAPPYAVLFASFALSIAIQAIIRNFISPKPQVVRTPDVLTGVWNIGEVSISYLSVITIVIAAIAIGGLTLLLRRTKYGLAIRAAADNFPVTRLMGAKAGNMILLAFVLSGLLAGIAGFLWISRTSGISPDMGFNPLLQAFIAVVLGGMGSLSGAVIGGFALATVEVALQAFLPPGASAYTTALTLLVVVAVLYVRPAGFLRTAEGRIG